MTPTNREIIEQASKESNELAHKIDAVVNEYLKSSNMSVNQKIVNVGRAVNAYHVNWIANLSGQLETANEKILNKGKL